MSLEKFIPKGSRVEYFWDRRNVLTGLNYTELQKVSTQYKLFLYNQLGITKMLQPTQNSREQMFCSIYNLHGIAEIFY